MNHIQQHLPIHRVIETWAKQHLPARADHVEAKFELAQMLTALRALECVEERKVN